MKIMKKVFYGLLLGLFFTPVMGQSYSVNREAFSVKLHGNAYITSAKPVAEISEKGLTDWTNQSDVISTYIYSDKPQTCMLYIQGTKQEGNASLEVLVGKQKFTVRLMDGQSLDKVAVGKIKLSTSGYHAIKLKGIKKKGKEFARIESFILEGIEGNVNYVGDFSPYWGTRGPSVHLNYTMPEQTTEWFYNEVTVPVNEDVIGSYYMANGFGEGYFGMQCNSESERRVLFSVWSPFDTQDPKLIPDEDKIKVLRKGKDVHIGEFGNEGSGGQSFLRYNWKSGVTYKFLTHIKPDGAGNTIYTAYFYATDQNEWRLIASFCRPKTNTYYTRAHSFLENFIPSQGYLSRKVCFTNQYCLGTDGIWRPVTKATFTHDATANAKARLDYAGGVTENNAFFLKNCGFFNDKTSYGTKLERINSGKEPVIDFNALNNL